MRHEDLEGDIAALAMNRLEGPARARLEQHVGECNPCAEMLASVRGIAASLRGSEAEAGAWHPDVVALREHARGARGPDSDRIARHLEACGTCALEASAWVRFLDSAQLQLSRTPLPLRRPSAGWIRAALALAAGLVLGFLLRGTGKPAPSGAGEVHVVEFSEGLRDAPAEETTTVRVGERVVVSVSLESFEPAQVGALLFEVIPKDADGPGATLWHASVEAPRVERTLRDGARFAFELPQALLGPGAYALRVSSARAPGGAPLLEGAFVVAPEGR
jgi:hypothetical protein